MLLKKDEILLKEGEKSNQLFWLLQGELVVVKKLQDHEVVLNQIKEGELVGELSFLDQKPRSATVRAVTDCQLHVLEYAEYQALLAAQPKWLKKILITLVKKIRLLSEI
ncbi:MAG: cyclic nucleotide-binding domain-containing protein [Bacteriovoracaceae bacterium]|nr:cyclic nucleotide-binding domain-containing protein [Bacteriovoracaceae bacterium]